MCRKTIPYISRRLCSCHPLGTFCLRGSVRHGARKQGNACLSVRPCDEKNCVLFPYCDLEPAQSCRYDKNHPSCLGLNAFDGALMPPHVFKEQLKRVGEIRSFSSFSWGISDYYSSQSGNNKAFTSFRQCAASSRLRVKGGSKYSKTNRRGLQNALLGILL